MKRADLGGLADVQVLRGGPDRLAPVAELIDGGLVRVLGRAQELEAAAHGRPVEREALGQLGHEPAGAAEGGDVLPVGDPEPGLVEIGIGVGILGPRADDQLRLAVADDLGHALRAERREVVLVAVGHDQHVELAVAGRLDRARDLLHVPAEVRPRVAAEVDEHVPLRARARRDRPVVLERQQEAVAETDLVHADGHAREVAHQRSARTASGSWRTANSWPSGSPSEAP